MYSSTVVESDMDSVECDSLKGDSDTDKSGRWIQLNHTIVPCVWSDGGSLLAPLPLVVLARGSGADDTAADLNQWQTTPMQRAFLNQMCRRAGLDFEFPRKTALVGISDLLRTTATSQSKPVFVKLLSREYPLEDVDNNCNSCNNPNSNNISMEQEFCAGFREDDQRYAPRALIQQVTSEHSVKWSQEAINLAAGKQQTTFPVKQEPHTPDIIPEQYQQDTGFSGTHQIPDTYTRSLKTVAAERAACSTRSRIKTGQASKRISQVWAAASASLTSGGAMTVKSTTNAKRPLSIHLNTTTIKELLRGRPEEADHVVPRASPSHVPPHLCNSHGDVMNYSSCKRNYTEHVFDQQHGVIVDKACPVKFHGKTITCMVSTRSECYISLDTLWQNYFAEYISSPLLIRHYLESEKDVTWMALPTTPQESVTCGDVYARLRDVAKHMDELQWMLGGQENQVSRQPEDTYVLATSDIRPTCEYSSSTEQQPCLDLSTGHISECGDSMSNEDIIDLSVPLDLSLKRAASV